MLWDFHSSTDFYQQSHINGLSPIKFDLRAVAGLEENVNHLRQQVSNCGTPSSLVKIKKKVVFLTCLWIQNTANEHSREDTFMLAERQANICTTSTLKIVASGLNGILFLVTNIPPKTKSICISNLYRCTVHFVVYFSNTLTNAHI
jgi:hypothetical protein